MSRVTAPVDIGRAWRAVASMFVLNGALYGIWASRIPAVTDIHSITHATLGIALLLLAAGAICSFALAGRLVDHFGAAPITQIVAVLYALSLLLLAIAPDIKWLCIFLFVFGAFHGSMDIAMNAWGADVERTACRPLMSSLHAMFSLGAGVGALSGYVAIVSQVSLLMHFVLAGGFFAIAGLYFASIRWQTQRVAQGEAANFALPSGALLLVGLVAFCSSVGEGAMADWSAIFLRDAVEASEDQAAIGYAAFSTTMVIVRFAGDRLIQWLGATWIARASGLCSISGVMLAVAVTTLPATLIGFALMGVGYALIMPLAFSRAANDPKVPPGRAIASVATLGYGGLLLGPPVIGFMATATSLPASIAMLAILGLATIALAPALQRR